MYREFSQAVIEQIGYYVYLLIDPRSERVFYVGKGISNRVFQHLTEAHQNDASTDKLDLIREIHEQGLKVEITILRHGLTEKEAFEVEAAVIDLLHLGTLTNQVAGQKSYMRGMMSIAEIDTHYDAQPAIIHEPIMLININRLFHPKMSPSELYDSTRGDWVVGKRRDTARYALSVYRGIVRQVYEIQSWQACEQLDPTRWRFDGTVSNELQHYVGKTVSQYITQGAQNPIKYLNC